MGLKPMVNEQGPLSWHVFTVHYSGWTLKIHQSKLYRPYINQTFIMWLGGLGRLVVCPDYSGGTWISSSFFKVTSSINHFSRGLSHLQLGNQSRSLWITWLVLIVPIWAKWVHQTHAVSHKRLPESKHVHPWKLTWHCKTSVSNRNCIFKWWIFHLSC